jgi:hypothetical protein
MAAGDVLGSSGFRFVAHGICFRLLRAKFLSASGSGVFQVPYSPCSPIGDAQAHWVYADDSVAHGSMSRSDLR